MKQKIKKLYLQQKKRYLKKIKGTEERPRLSVFRSHNHIYAQLINDQKSQTISSSSTLEKNISSKINSSSTKEAAYIVGEEIAKKIKEKEIQSIVFDRGNRPYHGRIKSLAEGARNQGLIF